jgi:hypothetical protein
MTNAGGLWRYRLDDLVVVDAVLGRTPSIRFVGKCSREDTNPSESFSPVRSRCTLNSDAPVGGPVQNWICAYCWKLGQLGPARVNRSRSRMLELGNELQLIWWG